LQSKLALGFFVLLLSLCAEQEMKVVLTKIVTINFFINDVFIGIDKKEMVTEEC